jgi:hypothetical protein
MGQRCYHHTLPHATGDGLDAPTRSASFSGHYLGTGSRDMSHICDQYSGRPCVISTLARVASANMSSRWRSRAEEKSASLVFAQSLRLHAYFSRGRDRGRKRQQRGEAAAGRLTLLQEAVRQQHDDMQR